MVKGKIQTKDNFGYKKLVLYQKAKKLVLITYKLTVNFPRTEIYSLVPQMRRAAVSVMANIVEGYAKDSSAEFARYLTISIGSITELEVYIDLSYELNFIDKKRYDIITTLVDETKTLLYGSRKAVRLRVR